jgi:hypothetical protein
MHLSTLYARDLGVQPSKPIIVEHFFPLPCSNYITFHNSEKVQSKSYSYWTEVLEIIKPHLNNLNIKVVQIGQSKDAKVEGVDYYITNTSFKHSFFLIKNAMLHLGIDSSPVHIASAFDKPTVSIYSHTYSNTCYPLWNENKRVIESNRGGKKPSFSLFEDPKTIDLIKPEEIAQAVLDLLNIKQTLAYKTINIGSKFLNKEINLIPNDLIPTVDVDNAEIVVRLDMKHDENFLFSFLMNNKCNISINCSKPIKNINYLMSFKSRINKINYYSNQFDKGFVDFLRSNVFNMHLFCTSEETLNDQRLDFFDHEINYFNPQKEALKLKEQNHNLLIDEFKIKTGRIYIHGKDKFKTLGENINDLKFWLDFEHFMIYNE